MKKVFAIALAASVLAFLSCESTKQESAAQSPEPNKVEQASTSAAPAEKEVKKESAPVSTAISSKSQYKKLLQDIKISVLSSPRETVKGKAFASPYKIQVTNLAGEPLASLKMTAEYPASRKQETVNFETMENVELEIKGRHDPAIIHRARAVVDALTALVIADLICIEKGTGWLA